MIRVDQWSPADHLHLEPNALVAVKELDRNLALSAGPGAGKTEMLAQRADFLLRSGTCRYPKRILAISFKVDASQNLKSRVRMRCGPELAKRFDSHTFHAFAKRIIDRFRPALTGPDALQPDYRVEKYRRKGHSITFDDMVPLAVKIVRSSKLAHNAIRQTYSHVFLDEFQDCTDNQYDLIRSCFHHSTIRLTAVGDAKQRIMTFAGALDDAFDLYTDDFDALSLKLYQNFRSAPKLRRMQNAMVRVMDPPAAVDDTELLGDEGEISVLRFDSDNDEAVSLADHVRLWIDDGADPSEIAVLVSKQQSLYCQRLLSELTQRGVPYRDEDLTQNLASEPVARLIVDFLLVAAADRQPEPFQRLLDRVVFGQGLDQENEYRARSRLDRLVATVKRSVSKGAIDLADRDALRAVVKKLLEVVGYDVVVALSPDYAQGSFLQEQIDATTDRLHKTLSESVDPATALGSFSGDRSVKIMSIHKSKGLEFDTVVILGVERETFWAEEETERSTFFVGISRAKRRLYLTVCGQRQRPEGATRWDVARTEHDEFVGFAAPFL